MARTHEGGTREATHDWVREIGCDHAYVHSLVDDLHDFVEVAEEYLRRQREDGGNQNGRFEELLDRA